MNLGRKIEGLSHTCKINAAIAVIETDLGTVQKSKKQIITRYKNCIGSNH